MKEKEDLKKEIEAVLFAAGRKVSLEEIAKLCKADQKEVEDALKEIKEDYSSNQSPLFLTEEGDGYKLTVREKYLPLVKEVTPHTELSRSMLGTLAVIAWKQPVMQSEVINIRTSKAYEDIKELVDLGFISKEKKGRTYIIKPTGKFFEYFDLPSKEAMDEVFREVKDDEPEVQAKLNEQSGKSEEGSGGQESSEGRQRGDDENGSNQQGDGSQENAQGSEGSIKEDFLEGEKLGRLQIYEKPETGKKEKDNDSGDSGPAMKEKLGGLEVFTEKEEKKQKEADQQGADEGGQPEEAAGEEEGEGETEEQEENTDKNEGEEEKAGEAEGPAGDEDGQEEKAKDQEENTDENEGEEEKAREFIHKLAEEDDEESGNTRETGKKGENPDLDWGEEAKDSGQEKKQGKGDESGNEENNSRLPKELEEFAGDEDNKKDDNDEESGSG
ncbi:MAG: SMC-Scp complex subunit ScpB [Candidatus Woesearchaeota archaeon]